MGEKVIAVSGGFDPIHVGHLRMMQDAAQHGRLVVIVNSDEWLLKKKGYVFMPWEERAELIGAYDFVDEVVMAKDDNRTVVESLKEIKPDIFANGGDRTKENIPEMTVSCLLSKELHSRSVECQRKTVGILLISILLERQREER